MPKILAHRWGIFTITTLWLLIGVAFSAHKTGPTQLADFIASLFFFGAIIRSVVIVFRDWSQFRILAILPLTGCLVAVPIAFHLGTFIHHRLFLLHLPEYKALVSKAESETAIDGDEAVAIALSEADKETAYFVLAQREHDGNLLVEIDTEGGFPAKHSGYVFSASGFLDGNSYIGKRWPYQKRVQSQWFHVSD